MISGYVLIAAVLLLSGVIATVGDRIGMRIGKARLSLFNLRPRQTATLVSILTGGVISASTLALLFGVSSQLRTGVFELQEIQEALQQAEQDLSQARDARETVEAELEESIEQRSEARQQLQQINQSLETALAQRQQARQQLQRTRQQLEAVSQQAQTLRREIVQLRQERQSLLSERNAAVAERDAAVSERRAAEADIARLEARLEELEAQRAFLDREVEQLERQYQGLFRGNIALARNEELASAVFRLDSTPQATQAVNQLLFQANRVALQRIAPGSGPDRQVILISSREVEQIIDRLDDGEEYLVRILSAANYVTGEPCVIQGEEPCIQVFSDVTRNRIIYQPGERLASTVVEASELTNQRLLERFNLLLAAAQFRARQDGVVGDQPRVADNRTEAVVRFLTNVQQLGDTVELRAIASEPIYTVGPIHIELQAIRDGDIILQTRPPTPDTPETSRPEPDTP
ncbi:hypothetical protein XM38_032180 [Halomicronema hongdechloris C2206]|uniref:DUF3084 domain-containing protein n=1 Tax=Halomicronema hongdechloris C2206 TaxID=1641165 RepID=A0A1Z3HPM6_9CYAN|nr:DUF3084 domain-containing protein [Halomicronema hongdechloris]ASC72263.1 hypothetical protein XM38_032180 [Halomicronema hongdechloris C2206]